MGKISIYQPGLTVPVQPAVMTNPADASAGYDAIAQGSDRLLAAYEQKKKEDTSLALANERIKADHDLTMAHLDDVENGRVGEGYVDTVKGRVNEWYAGAQERFADNPDALAALVPFRTDLDARFTEQAVQVQSNVAGARKLQELDDSVTRAAGTVMRDPSQLDRQQATINAAVGSILNNERRAKATEMAKSLPYRYLQGLVGDGNERGFLQAEAFLKDPKNDGTVDPQGRANIESQIFQARNRMQDSASLAYQAQAAVAQSKGAPKPELPGKEAIGEDNYNRLVIQDNKLTESEIKERQAIADVKADLIGGKGIAPTDERKVKAVDSIFEQESAPAINGAVESAVGMENAARQLNGQEPMDAEATAKFKSTSYAGMVRQYVGAFGVVPSEVENVVVRGARSKDPEEVVRAAELYGGLIVDRHGQFKPDMNEKETEILRKVNYARDTGHSDQEAVNYAWGATLDDVVQSDTQKQEMSRRFSNDTKPTGGRKTDPLDDFLQSKSGGGWFSTSAQMKNVLKSRYTDMVKMEYMKPTNGGNIGTAKTAAYARLLSDYQVTEINGVKEFYRGAPETHFSVGGMSPSENAAWMRKQAAHDAGQGSFEGEGYYQKNLKIMPDVNGRRTPDGKPVYNLFVTDKDGKDVPVSDRKTNLPLAWQPDAATAPEVMKMMDLAKKVSDKNVQGAAAKRAGNRGELPEHYVQEGAQIFNAPRGQPRRMIGYVDKEGKFHPQGPQ